MKYKNIEVWAALTAAGAAYRWAKKMIDYVATLKVYIPELDKARSYRADEIAPKVWEVLERARKHRGAIHITKKSIDKIIYIQNQSSQKAINYIRWRFCGDMTYIEAFFDAKSVSLADQVAAQQKQIDEINTKLAEIIKALEEQGDKYID